MIIIRQLFTALIFLLSAVHGYAQDAERRVGVAGEGLTGIRRVGMPYDMGPAVMLTGAGGYGYTESFGPVAGAHHRLVGTIGIGGRIWPFLGIGLNFTGRYDTHPADEEGKDSSIIGDPRFLIRGGYPLTPSFHLGGEINIWVPGADAPSLAWDATTVDFKLLAALLPEKARFTIAGYTGFRFDNSQKAAPDLERTRAGDRMSLGVSDFHGVLIGLGGAVQLSPFEIISEFSWDILVGSGAPNVSRSPIRLSLGLRYYPMVNLGIELLGEASLCSRPGMGADDPLVPIEPRMSVILGVTYTFDLRKQKSSDKEDITDDDPGTEAETAVTPFSGQVLDKEGNEVAGAEVSLVAQTYSQTSSTDEKGVYRFEKVPVGSGTLVVTAEGYEPLEEAVTIPEVGAGLHQSTLVSAETTSAAGSQLRGLVRAFNGQGLRAQITILPLGEKLKTDAEGYFQLDVPPGVYTVKIQAKGFKAQNRKVTVEENGVSIINVDLRQVR